MKASTLCLLLAAACTVHAEYNLHSVLVDSIAMATAPLPMTNGSQFREKQIRAVEFLGEVRGSLSDEIMIVSALQKLRKSMDRGLADGAILALGKRDRRELIPEFFAEIETNPYAVRTFFYSMPGRQTNPPVAHLNAALNCRNPDARCVAVELVWWTKAIALRPAVEKLAVSDPADAVRADAASCLGILGNRESVPALRKALYGTPYVQQIAAYALTRVGGNAEVEVLLPFLKSRDAETRRLLAKGVGDMQLKDSKPVCDALLPLLSDPSFQVRAGAIESLGRFKDSRAIPGIRATVAVRSKTHWEDMFTIVDALASIGTEAAADVLNEMLRLGYTRHTHIEEAVTQLGFASSGRAAWDAYLLDPVHWIRGSDVPMGGYKQARPVLEKCADVEVFRAIRLRASRTTETTEKRFLNDLTGKLATRFPAAANEPIENVTSPVPTEAPSRKEDATKPR